MSIRMIYNVSEENVENVKQMFMLWGATSVQVAPETDGEFTVIAIFPDQERHKELVERIDAVT
jgi:phosphoribosylformylglycinamidine (FGAM) synthase-like enzyme